MTFEQIAGLVLALMCMSVGLVGSLLPGLPGPPLILLVAVGHRLYFGPSGPGNLVLIFLATITVVALLLDYLASLYGARRLGATWRGVLGAMVGGVIGLFFGPPGMLVGPFLGAAGLELLSGRKPAEAGKAGLGAALGMLAGAVGKLACSAAMIVMFAVNVIARS